MFVSTYATDPNLISLSRRRRLLDNQTSRQMLLNLTTTKIPTIDDLGYPNFLLQHTTLTKTGDLTNQLDRKELFSSRNPNKCSGYESINDIRERNYSENLQAIGPSSLQIFEGEDEMKFQRDKIKKNMQKKWLEKQIMEKSLGRIQENEQESQMEKSYFRHGNVLNDYEKQEKQDVLSYNKSVENYNKQMSLHKSLRKEAEEYEEENVNNLDRNSHVESNILNQSFKDSFKHHVFIPHYVKTMEQSADLFQQKLNLQKKDEEFWNRKSEIEARKQEIEERQRLRTSRERSRQLMIENIRLSEEQKIVQSRVYKSLTEDDFYEQFGKSHR